MDRRAAMSLMGRTGVIAWAASFWGDRQAKKTISQNQPNTAEAQSQRDLDTEHRLKRERLENQQLTSTVTATLVGSSAAALAVNRSSTRINSQASVDYALNKIPPREITTNIPPTTLHNRRQVLNQLGAGLLFGSSVGPAITWFADRGNKLANETHGNPVPNEDTVITQHRAITAARQDLLATIENTGLITGAMLAVPMPTEDKKHISEQCIAIGKHKLQTLLSGERNNISFTADGIDQGESLLHMIPDSLKRPQTQLNITTTIPREGPDTVQYTARYDEYDNAFYLSSVNGNPDKNNIIILQNGMNVKIEVVRLGSAS